MTYRVMNAGRPGESHHLVVWKGNEAEPVATCNDPRDARRIVDALNRMGAVSCRVSLAWINVDQRLPDADQLVLVWVPSIDQMVMAARGEAGWYADDSIFIKSGITHWADPAAPTE